MSEPKEYFTVADDGHIVEWFSEPRQYSYVKFVYEDLPEEYHAGYPFFKNVRYIYLGEIPNMPGHCIVMDDDGKHYVGFHTENFKEISDEYPEDDDSVCVSCEMDEFYPISSMNRKKK